MQRQQDIPNWYGRAVGSWVAAMYRWAAGVLIVALCVTVGAVYVLATQLQINTDNEDMLSADLPFRQDSKAIDDAFPQFSDNLLVVVEAGSADLADDAALALAARLRQTPAVFGSVYDPAGDPFFRRNGLLYMDLEDLEGLADRLAEAQPFLAALWRDQSLRGLAAMLELVIDAVLDGQADTPIAIAPFLNAIADVAAAQRDGRFAELSWQQIMQGQAGDNTPTIRHRRFLVIQPRIDFESLRPAADAMSALRSLAIEMHLTPERGVRVRLTGSAALNHEELSSVEQGMEWAGLISLMLVLILLTLAFRSWVLVLAALVVLVVGLIWTAAFALLAIGTFNLISVAFSVLFIGLSVDFAIHFILRFRESCAAGTVPADALRESGEQLGGALSLCAVCAALAFYGFLPTDYRGLAELGLIAGTGMFVALFANLTLLPALLAILPATAPARSDEVAWTQALAARVRGREGTVLWGALAAALVSAMLLPKTTFDFDPLNLKDPETESVATLMDLIDDPNVGPYAISILARDFVAADALSQRLEALPEVASVETISAYVPADQEQKLDVIADLGLFLAPALGAPPKAAPTDAERHDAATRLSRALARLAAHGSGETAISAERLHQLIEELGRSNGYVDLEQRLLVRLPGRIEALMQSFGASAVTLADIPSSIMQRNVSADGRVTIRVNPSADMRDREALKRFVDAVRTIEPHASGSPVIILEAGRAVIRSFIEAGAIAIVGISIILSIMAAGWREVVLVFTPLLLAGLMTCAAAVILGLSFNFANIIVLPLLFGLGVASTIHLVWRDRESTASGGAFGTSTARAVFYSALTTIGSFASIAISSHPGTASMGTLLTVAITLTLLCTLVLTPALLATRTLGGMVPDRRREIRE